MNYENFGSITKRHRIVYQNWPVSFCSPTRLSVLELQTLHGLLHSENPPPLFRKLTSAEFKVFEDAIESGTLETLPPLPPVNVPIPTVLAGPSNSEANNRSGANTDNLEITGLPPRSTSSLTPPTPLVLTSSAPSTSAFVTPAPLAPAVIPTPAPAPRGGTLLSFDGKKSALVLPKPRAKHCDANMSTAESKAAKAAKMAEKAEMQARKAAGKGTRT